MVDRGHEGLSKKNYRTYSKLYRDPASFEVIENEVLWELGKDAVQRGAGHAIEAWSCGCSAGEEVFSLLMSWEQVLAEHFVGVDLSCLGTDISADAIEAAQRAEYGEHAVQDVPEAWLERCFDIGHLEQQQTYTVQQRLKRHATFTQQDVRETLPNKSFDLITCRYSVFLYCSKDECATFLRQLVEYGCLRPGGFLFIGQPDELPSAWRSLGLQNWRGHVGLYRLAHKVSPITSQPSSIYAAHSSLSDFLGNSVRRPATERIGRPEEQEEAEKLTPEQMALNLERFEKWHQLREERAAQLRAEALQKENEEIAAPVFISQKKVEAFARRMQDEAARREKKLQESRERGHAAEKKNRKARKVAVARRKTRSQSEQTAAAVQRAAQASALWIARTRTKADHNTGTWGAPSAVYASKSASRSHSTRRRSASGARQMERLPGTHDTRGALSAREGQMRLFTEVEKRRQRSLDMLRSGKPNLPQSERERRALEFRIRLEAQEQQRIRQIAAAHQSDESSNTSSDNSVSTTSDDGTDIASDDGASIVSEEDLHQNLDEVQESTAPLQTAAIVHAADVDLAPPSFSPTGSSFSPTGSFLTVMVASPSEHKLGKHTTVMVAPPGERKVNKHKKMKKEVELLLTGVTTDNTAATTAASARAANRTVSTASTPRLSPGSTQAPVNLPSEPYLAAITGAKEPRNRQTSEARFSAHTTAVPPNSDRSCAKSNFQPAAATAAPGGTEEIVGLVEDCVTQQNVPYYPDLQQHARGLATSADYMRRQAQNGTASAAVATSGIGFGKGSVRPPFAHMRQQTQQHREKTQPSSVDAQHCGRTVASAYSAAKQYSSDARQRCSKIAGLQSKTEMPSAATLSRRPTFEHDWVQAIAAQPKLVTTPDGRRSWVRGW